MKWWFKRYPTLLSHEIKHLTANSNYEPLSVARKNLLLSSGNILVRSNKISRYPILIIYRHSFPYSLPEIFLLKHAYNQDELDQLATQEYDYIIHTIHDNITFYGNYRHQNPHGYLCILESDNLTGKPEFYSINTVLDRVRDWFAGHETGRFPPDSAEVELFAHFKKRDNSIDFLYPEVFSTHTSYQGVFHCFTVSNPIVDSEQKGHRIFIGAVLLGQTENGVFTETLVHNNVLQNFPIEIDTPIKLIENHKMADKAIRDGWLLKGYWWQIDTEPSIFDTVEELALIIGNQSAEQGYKRLSQVIGQDIRFLPDQIYIALRFQSRRGNIEWQLFKLVKTGGGGTPVIGSANIEDFQSLLANYLDILAIHCEAFHDQNFHERNSVRAIRSVLKATSVAVVGCGALGGEIADALSKAGVGRLILTDKDEYRAHNMVRHVLPITLVGLPKVIALQIYLNEHNPFIEVNSRFLSVLSNDINTYVPNGAIAVSTMADDNTEGFLNEQAIVNNVTVYYARALRGGKVGRIIRVIPGQDACLYCLSLHHSDRSDIYINIPEDPTLPTLTNECNNPVRPASAADLKIISSITSRIILDYLQNGKHPINHWIWSSEELSEAIQPYSTFTSFIPPHPDCPYCSTKNSFGLVIAKRAFDFMSNEVKDNSGIETGGVLVGFEKEGFIHVVEASGPGSNAKKSVDGFSRDVEYCQNFLDQKFLESDGNLIYIGEWHSHPNMNNKPSQIDIKSLNEIAIQQNYLTDHPVMIIFNQDNDINCTVHPALRKFYNVEPMIVDF